MGKGEGVYMRAWIGKSGWLAVCLLMLAACAPAPDQARLRQRIGQFQADVGQGRIDAALEVMADDFIGNDGMDRRAVARLLRLQLLRNRRVGIVTGPVAVDVDGGHASASFSVALAAGQGMLPGHGSLLRFQTHWRQQRGDWVVYRARWAPATGQ